MDPEHELEQRGGKPYSRGLKIIKRLYPTLLTHGILLDFKSDDILACCGKEIKPEWRRPIVKDDEIYRYENEWTENAYLIGVQQEEYCWSTCQDKEGRCHYGNRTDVMVPISYKELLPFLKEDPDFMCQMIDKVPNAAVILTGKPLDRLKEWQHSLVWDTLGHRWILPKVASNKE